MSTVQVRLALAWSDQCRLAVTWSSRRIAKACEEEVPSMVALQREWTLTAELSTGGASQDCLAINRRQEWQEIWLLVSGGLVNFVARGWLSD
ncbi:hypothetical protein ACPXB3_13010 [Gordonia sp. DT219]|uniref:hypothetical protein n=2 Tax=unclassified Gordonia (in: high G+C Gram-positive bacteria) TaxID=2657482 RepID=UPI003CF98405